jgi:hypothetical protein
MDEFGIGAQGGGDTATLLEGNSGTTVEPNEGFRVLLLAASHGVTEIGHLIPGQSFAGLTDSGAILLHDTTAGAADPWTVLSPAGVSQSYPAWPPG